MSGDESAVDFTIRRRTVLPSPRSAFMNTPDSKPRSLTPAEIPFTSPHMLNRSVTDTGKILPRKYTGFSSKHQRAVTKTLKRSRNMLLAR
jgi:small subunit ribosomal protein S18